MDPGALAQRIQSLRRGCGLSQEALAEAVGVSRQAVSKGESGQSLPELEKVVAMSERFGVAADALLKGEEACACPHGKEGWVIPAQQDPGTSRTAGWRQAALILLPLLPIALLAAFYALFF